MDAQHFDAFVRSLSLGTSRRVLATGLLGGIFGALSGLAENESAAKKRKKGKGKKGKKKKKPQCTEPLVACPDGCVDLASDTNNCGECGTVCAENATCEDGFCFCGGTECLAGSTCCSDECVNTETNIEHCGTCGKRCTMNETCEAGVCMCGQIQCGDGFTCCEEGGCLCSPGPTGGFGTVFGSPVGETCQVEEVGDNECPAGLTTCSGPEGFCRACCPANSTCDPSRGVCLPII